MATRLFAEGGFHKVKLADIANEVGITQAGLLHHFPSKRTLLMAMLEKRDETYLKSQHKLLATGRPYLEIFIESLLENEKTPKLVQLFAILSAESLVEEHPAHDWFETRYCRIVTFAEQELGKMIDPAKLPDAMTIEDLARCTIGLADGLRLQWLRNPEQVSRVKIMQHFKTMLNPYLRDEVVEVQVALQVD